jgi:hypothetical protein
MIAADRADAHDSTDDMTCLEQIDGNITNHPIREVQQYSKKTEIEEVTLEEVVDDEIEPIPFVQQFADEENDEREARQRKEQLERDHHNHHHHRHHQQHRHHKKKKKKKRSAVHNISNEGPPSLNDNQSREEIHHPTSADNTDTEPADNDNSDTNTSSPSVVIEIQEETAPPANNEENVMREAEVFIPEATLVEEVDSPREHKFLKQNLAIVAVTLLVIVALIAILFATTEKKDTKSDTLQNSSGPNTNKELPTPSSNTQEEQESFRPSDPEDRFFVCEDVTDKVEGCLDAECIGDSSCNCMAYHRIKKTKEITGYCDSCTVCDNLLITMGFECNNLAKEFPEEVREMADPHGPLGSNQCSNTETDTQPTGALEIAMATVRESLRSCRLRWKNIINI